MARMDFSESDVELLGWWPCVVTESEERMGKKANMFQIVLRPHGTTAEVKDWIMLGGKAARWHSKKTKAILGNTEDFEDGEEIYAEDLLERRVWACFKKEPYSFEGRDGKEIKGVSTKVDAERDGSECGYLPANAAPWPDEGEEYNPEAEKWATHFGSKVGFDDPTIPWNEDGTEPKRAKPKKDEPAEKPRIPTDPDDELFNDVPFIWILWLLPLIGVMA